MHLPASDYIKPLSIAENHFLQVLFDRLVLNRIEVDGRPAARLELEIHEDQLAIWGRHGKDALQRTMSGRPRDAERVQHALDAFLIQNEGTRCEIKKEDGLWFRYGSGGTLPIVRRGKQEYYALFYREIDPIGWNIANGGCDSREEMLAPFETVDRELREELLILDPKRNRRCVFHTDLANPLERPEFLLVRGLLERRHPQLRVSSMEEWRLPVKFIDGPDQLVVTMGGQTETTTCFLNINAKDFGIEVDRVAWMSIDDEAILMDGEPTGTLNNQLVNAPIGLFEIERFHHMLRNRVVDFRPDEVFHDATRNDGSELEVIRDKFMRNLEPVHSPQEKDEYWSAERKYDLCPVTRAIVARYLATIDESPPNGDRSYDVFISHASGDVSIATRLCDALETAGKRAFFSKRSIRTGNYATEVDDALDSAKHMIVVGTSLENVKKPWVQYEWTRFHVALHNGQKPGGSLIPYIGEAVVPALLPGPLAINQCTFIHEVSPENFPTLFLDALRDPHGRRGG